MHHELPNELLNNLEGINGFDKASFQSVHNNYQNITSIRFNEDKIKRNNSIETIQSLYNIDKKVSWCEHAFYLKERPSFTLDPLLHAGAYYVQEASSMFLNEVVKQTCENTDKKVLDLCAAPGGKSSLLASYFKDGLVVCNEVIKQRVNILYENLVKWGTPNIIITNNDAADFKRVENYFDVINIDAPCSGSGLFRKDNEAIEEWSMQNVNLCSQRQQRIVADAYSSLKQDGVLIYSTCSYSKEEDEDILDWIKDNFDVESFQLILKDEWNIVETQSTKHKQFGYRFWPGKTKGEGFFIAAFKKNDCDNSNYKNSKTTSNKSTKNDTAIALKYVDESDWGFFNNKENIHAIHNKWIDDLQLLQKNLYVKKAGIKLGEIIRKELIPHHEFAVSTIIKKDIQKIEFDMEQSLQYLRKKDLKINTDLKGWTLSTYKNFSLGCLKFLHNRVNNYYPTEWRILKG